MNTIIPPIYLKAIFYIARLREKGQGFVINHPLLLFVAALVYLLVGDIAVFVAVALALLVMFPVGWAFSIVEPEWTNTAIVLVLIIGAALEMIILVDFIRLVLLCFFSASSLRSITDPVFRVLQLVALTVILFAIAHYYVDLFANTDNVGYTGLSHPIPKGGWRSNNNVLDDIFDRLKFVPSRETVIDCIYFSTVTTATVGYGDMAPHSFAAKVLTIIQIIFSFGLIVVALGWVIGHANDRNRE